MIPFLLQHLVGEIKKNINNHFTFLVYSFTIFIYLSSKFRCNHLARKFTTYIRTRDTSFYRAHLEDHEHTRNHITKVYSKTYRLIVDIYASLYDAQKSLPFEPIESLKSTVVAENGVRTRDLQLISL